MDQPFSERQRIRLGMSLDEPMVTEPPPGAAPKKKRDEPTGPPQGFRPGLIRGVSIAGAVLGAIGLMVAVLPNREYWALLALPGVGLSLWALRIANDDFRLYGEDLAEPYLSELTKARNYAIGSLCVIGGFLLLLVLAMFAMVIFNQIFGGPAASQAA